MTSVSGILEPSEAPVDESFVVDESPPADEAPVTTPEVQEAAVIQVAEEVAVAVEETGEPPVRLLTRQHLQDMRDAGCTRADAETLVRDILGPAIAKRALNDLDSFGTWNGD